MPDIPPEVTARMMADQMAKFNPLMPWETMTEKEQKMFLLFCRYLVWIEAKSPVHFSSPELTYPTIIFLLRVHGRSLDNVLVEWEVDKDGFMDETDRQRKAFEHNLHQLARTYGRTDFFDEPDIPSPDTTLRTVFEKIFDTYRTMRDAGEM